MVAKDNFIDSFPVFTFPKMLGESASTSPTECLSQPLNVFNEKRNLEETNALLGYK